ncbi:MAG: hypothetical protein ACI4U4_05115 [Bacilli bacterium]
MENEQFEKMMSSIKEKIRNEKEKLLEEENQVKIKNQAIDEILNSNKQLSLTFLLNQLKWLQIPNNDAINMIKTAVEVGLDKDLPLAQYKTIMSSIIPMLEQLKQTNNQTQENINNRILRLSNYSSVSSIKNNISDFEKDAFSVEGIDQIELGIVLCLMSCDDFKFQEEKEQLESLEEIEKYEDFKEKIEVYEKKFEPIFEDLIKKFEQYSEYNVPEIKQQEFYKLHFDIRKSINKFYADKANIDRVKEQIVRNNILEQYTKFIETYKLTEENLKELKENVDKLEKLCNLSTKEKQEKLVNDIEQKTTIEESQKEVLQEQPVEEKTPEEPKIIEKPAEEEKEYFITEEQQALINRAIIIHDYFKELNNSMLNNFIPSLEVCIKAVKKEPSDSNTKSLEQIIDTMKQMSLYEDAVDKQIFEKEQDEEEPIDYEEGIEYDEIGTQNIVLFLKDDSEEFCINEDFEEMGKTGNIRKRTEKEFNDMIRKITNIDFPTLKDRVAKKLKTGDYTEVEKLNPRRLKKGDSRYSLVRLNICEEKAKELRELGYNDFENIFLIGGVIGEKKGDDLMPLVKELQSNIKYINYLNELLNNPKTSVDKIKEIIDESNDYYMNFCEKSRKGRE